MVDWVYFNQSTRIRHLASVYVDSQPREDTLNYFAGNGLWEIGELHGLFNNFRRTKLGKLKTEYANATSVKNIDRYWCR